MLENINPSDILQWNTGMLWNAFKQLEEETGLDVKEEIEIVKNGINIKVPIWYFIEEWYDLYPNTKRAKVMGYGKMSIKDFMEEKEERDKIMRKILLENLKETGPETPRT